MMAGEFEFINMVPKELPVTKENGSIYSGSDRI